MEAEERRELAEQAVELLQKAGVVCQITGDGEGLVEIVVDHLRVLWDHDNGMRLYLRDEGDEFEITRYGYLHTISFKFGFPRVFVGFGVKREALAPKVTDNIKKRIY
jgi:hypothetical protein